MGATRKAVLLNAATTTGAGSSGGPAPSGRKSFHAVLTGTGAVSAVMEVQGSNDNSNWGVLAVLSPSGTTTAAAQVELEASWLYYRGNVVSISGTGAAITVTVGEQV